MFRLSTSIRNLLFTAVLLACGCESGVVSESASSPSALDELVESNYQAANPVASTVELVHPDEEPPITVDSPSRDRPVTAAMFCQKVSETNGTETAGTVTVNVWIKLLIARGHYIYAPTDTQGPFQALEVQLHDSSIHADAWKYPSSKPKNGSAIYVDSVVMHRQLKLSADAVSNLEATVHFQVCNEDVCYPPATMKLVGSFGRLP